MCGQCFSDLLPRFGNSHPCFLFSHPMSLWQSTHGYLILLSFVLILVNFWILSQCCMLFAHKCANPLCWKQHKCLTFLWVRKYMGELRGQLGRTNCLDSRPMFPLIFHQCWAGALPCACRVPAATRTRWGATPAAGALHQCSDMQPLTHVA